MKNIFLFLLFIGLLSGCYDEYRLDYPYTTVAFSNATGGLGIPGVLARSVVKDEGLKLNMGVYLSGVLDNQEERWVEYEIDESILAGTQFELLPSSYYTLSDPGKIEIHPGEFNGYVTVSFDSAAFLNDPKAVDYKYAIPIRLTKTSEDSILSTQNTQILTIKYINHYEGFYNNKGSFITYSGSGEELNSKEFENVLTANTLGLDSVVINGLMNSMGSDYLGKLVLNADKSLYMEYIPVEKEEPVIENVALISTPSTSYVSSWEKLEAINDGDEPVNSGTKPTGGSYGNWPNDETWNWVQYDFHETYKITKSEVYWWTDGGGIAIPYNSYLEYWDTQTEEWKLVPNPVVNGESISTDDYGNTEKYTGDEPGFGVEADKFNETTFDEVVTDKVRLHFVAVKAQGIHEWKVTGQKGKLSGLEQETIEKITVIGDNSYDEANSTFNLKYRVNYVDKEHYTEVTSTMVWRNRIRDGVNEWRR